VSFGLIGQNDDHTTRLFDYGFQDVGLHLSRLEHEPAVSPCCERLEEE
jgi:hypothetical protein